MYEIIFGVVAVLVVGSLVLGSFFTISQQEAGVVERFGKFKRLASAGLNFKIPWIDSVGMISLRIEQLDVEVSTKTKDNVSVKMKVSAQHFVHPEKVWDAYYKLEDANKQITAFISDLIRTRVAHISLDELFEKKDEIALAVTEDLGHTMEGFGYSIMKALVTEINPPDSVEEAMNEINAAQRQRVAAQERGEAEKIIMVKQAEAEAESKRLQGEGIANQRLAIAKGIKESMEVLKKSGVEGSEATMLMLMGQYFDALTEIGANSDTNAIFLPTSPGALGDIAQQIMASQQAMSGNKDRKAS